MKTHKVRPALVEAKESSLHLSHRKLIDSIEPTGKSVLYNSIPQQLILISLEGEKIEVGDLVYELYPEIGFGILSDNHLSICEHPDGYDEDAFKVITTQSQLSPELIQQLVDEYNNGGMKDFEIEMEIQNIGLLGLTKANWGTKLTNGFVTVVEKEQTTCTKEEILSFFEQYEPNLAVSILKSEFIEWFNQNKKK